MNREIRKYPDPILKKRAEEVKEITPEIRKIIEKMKRIVKEDNNAAGLAAPQVGVSKRIIVVDTEKGPVAFINPKIIEKTKETEVIIEGCLSVPETALEIKRWKGVKVKALNEEDKEIIIEAMGFLARVFQQEIDHLNGILIIDRIPFWQKIKIKNK